MELPAALNAGSRGAQLLQLVSPIEKMYVKMLGGRAAAMPSHGLWSRREFIRVEQSVEEEKKKRNGCRKQIYGARD